MLAFDDGRCRVHIGHVLEELAALPADSVHCVMTSPPYWGLRDYKGLPDFAFGDGWVGQLGLEPTPDLYVAHMVEVFEAVRRVLRPDGTCWLNLGDSYATGAGKVRGSRPGSPKHTDGARPMTQPNRMPIPGLKPKDLVGIPWRVAFALQAAGWWLRSDIVWAKPNPMPESVTDRPTRSHEYLFLLAKSERYYYDAEAIKELASDVSLARIIKQPNFANQTGGPKDYRNGTNPNRSMRQTLENFAKNPSRNRRSVWTISTAPYPEAHFATFPPDLVRPCVLAGTAADGIVLDPFLGSGTTLEVAASLGRRGIGIEGNPTYLPLIEKRLRQGVLL
jgi:DNA modification methylase